METLADFECGELVVRYVCAAQPPNVGTVGLLIFPRAMESQLAHKRNTLKGEMEMELLGAGNMPATKIDSLVQLKLAGDEYSGAFAAGRTMRNSPSIRRFHFKEQRVEQSNGLKVVTVLQSPEGLRMEHTLTWTAGTNFLRLAVRFINNSSSAAGLEMLSSFSLSGITPFHPADAPGRLRVHRFRSSWSAEGRLDIQSIEALHLERSWSGAALLSERFGQVGTMPVRGWFPFVAVEDTQARVVWAAQLAWAGSWQMEISRQHDDLAISGGLADREFGHWLKWLAPGEEFITPEAAITCVVGDLDDACDSLLQAQAARQQEFGIAKGEEDLPIVFNEWGTTWGHPTYERIAAIAKKLQGTGIRYFVIDAGWYKPDAPPTRANWDNTHGDWIENAEMFPPQPPTHGLKGAADAIRAAGLIPGLWFEFETCGTNSKAFTQTKMLLHRDGTPITVRGRRFFNLNDPDAVKYLTQKVLGTLERCNIGYLKLDYNETLGIGCDENGDGSLGEGLRQQIEGTYRFIDMLRQAMPDLVIENCSSGGHRHEPSMLARTAMSSFSDAHELREIPIIAGNLQRLMQPSQCQVWAILRAADTPERLAYSLASTFLGRMCLSGEIENLYPWQWEMVHKTIALYRRVTPIIRFGRSRRQGEIGESWRHPTGWQSVVRLARGWW